MSKSKDKSTVTYRVTSQDADGNVSVQEGATDAPLKGDTFEYEHTEVRVGSIIKVERVTEEDGNVTVETVTALGTSDHTLEEPVEGDEIPGADELAADPGDDTTTASEVA